MIEIDGSYGESGGQILRTAIALSAVTGKPCKIFNIRKARRNPGLQAQHLASINAISALSHGEHKRAEQGATEIEFYPGVIRGGSFKFNVGTAGAIPLVLQPLIIASASSYETIKVEITGGTFVNWSPSIGFLCSITLKALEKMNYFGEIKIKKHGFYPKGGGLVEAELKGGEITPIELVERGKLHRIKVVSIASHDLKKANVAERMGKTAQRLLEEKFELKPDIKIEYVESFGSGGGIDLYAEYANSAIGSSALCERGKPSERVAGEAVDFLLAQHNSLAPLDEFMTDQILPFMALSAEKGDSRIKIPRLTLHAKTNIWVIEKFLPVKFDFDERENLIRCSRI